MRMDVPSATVRAETLCLALVDLGYTFATGVPCSSFDGAVRYFSSTPGTVYLPAANEGAAVAIACGVVMAGGKASVFIQNSGLGNLVNPLTSLCMVYDIPCLIFVSMRDSHDGPQHRVMGRATAGMLREIGVPFWDLPASERALPGVLEEAEAATRSGRPAFVLVRPGIIGPYDQDLPQGGPGSGRNWTLTRGWATRVIAEWLTGQYVVGSTGYIGRELFGISDRDRNFYMQGSMGHAAGVALGLAVARPDKDIVVIDGDGALLMHLGTLSTIGAAGARNLTHIVLDNGAYETTGGQPTTTLSTRLEDVATACGYRQGTAVTEEDDLRRALATGEGEGPRFIRVMISCEGEPEVGWATDSTSPAELRERFSAAISGSGQRTTRSEGHVGTGSE
jgi:phosphonopyruvate decarboxylase